MLNLGCFRVRRYLVFARSNYRDTVLAHQTAPRDGARRSDQSLQFFGHISLRYLSC
jgi:hypothetical protein